MHISMEGGTSVAKLVSLYEGGMEKKDVSSALSKEINKVRTICQGFYSRAVQENSSDSQGKFTGDKYPLSETLQKVSSHRRFFQPATSLNRQGTQYCGIPRLDSKFSAPGTVRGTSSGDSTIAAQRLANKVSRELAQTLQLSQQKASSFLLKGTPSKTLSPASGPASSPAFSPIISKTGSALKAVLEPPKRIIAETNRELKMRFLSESVVNNTPLFPIVISPKELPEQKQSALNGLPPPLPSSQAPVSQARFVGEMFMDVVDIVITPISPEKSTERAGFDENSTTPKPVRSDSHDSGITMWSDDEVPLSQTTAKGSLSNAVSTASLTEELTDEEWDASSTALEWDESLDPENLATYTQNDDDVVISRESFLTENEIRELDEATIQELEQENRFLRQQVDRLGKLA